MVCLYLPIIAVVVYSLDKSADLIGFTGFTTHWYSVAFHDPQVRRDLLTSLEVAVASTLPSPVGVAACAAGSAPAHASAAATSNGSVRNVMLFECSGR